MLLMKSLVVITVVIVFFFIHSFVSGVYLGVGECVAIYCRGSQCSGGFHGNS